MKNSTLYLTQYCRTLYSTISWGVRVSWWKSRSSQLLLRLRSSRPAIVCSLRFLPQTGRAVWTQTQLRSMPSSAASARDLFYAQSSDLWSEPLFTLASAPLSPPPPYHRFSVVCLCASLPDVVSSIVFASTHAPKPRPRYPHNPPPPPHHDPQCKYA